MKKLTSLITAVVMLTGYTSVHSGNNIAVSPSNVATFGAALNGKQIRKLLIGNTMVGRSYNFPSVGPIAYWRHFNPNGTTIDRYKIISSGKVDIANGTWRIKNSAQGVFCSKFAKRRKGVETCVRYYAFKNRFRTKPTEPDRKGVTGKVVPGNQVQ